MAVSVILFLTAVLCSLCHADTETVVVKTSLGSVKGYTDQTIHGRRLNGFKGLPYAKPPIGELRFKDPEAALAWEGTLDATKAASHCSQHPYDNLSAWNFTELIGQEDCLTLNVFTPELENRNGVGLPVMVFFHGGAFMFGGANVYPPYAMLDADVVLVVVQYRLGVLGFLSTEDEFAPGNLGLKDQSLALRWVQQNIASFGGDRHRVTLFGESAGGASAHYHLLTKHSKGLFRRAILQSGTATCPWASTVNPALSATAITEHLGCPSAPSHQLVHCLQEKPVEEVVSAYSIFFELGVFPIKTAPFVDGNFLEEHPAVLLKEGRHADVDIMIGVTKDEGAWISTMLYSVKKMYVDLNEKFNKVATVSLGIPEDVYEPLLQAIRVYKRYLGQNIKYAVQGDDVTQLYGDRFFNVPSDNTAMSHLINSPNNKVFKYEFVHRGKQSFIDLFSMEFLEDKEIVKNWVSHVDELAYLFPDSFLFKHHEDEDDKRMTDLMVKLWSNFAATGNPTPDDSMGFLWLPATEQNFQHLIIKSDPEMGEDQRNIIRKFWNSFPLPENILPYPEKFQNIVEEMARLEREAEASDETKEKRDEL